jgi:hypothetical protein
MAVDAGTENQPAYSQAANKDGEYCRGGRCGRAENQPEFAEPPDLIDESTEARSKEQTGGLPGSVDFTHR